MHPLILAALLSLAAPAAGEPAHRYVVVGKTPAILDVSQPPPRAALCARLQAAQALPLDLNGVAVASLTDALSCTSRLSFHWDGQRIVVRTH